MSGDITAWAGGEGGDASTNSPVAPVSANKSFSLLPAYGVGGQTCKKTVLHCPHSALPTLPTSLYPNEQWPGSKLKFLKVCLLHPPSFLAGRYL